MKPTFKQIGSAKQILSDAGYIGIWQLFSDQDVNHRCSELGFEKPNDDEMVEIIATIETEFNGNTGINWDAIDNGIIDVMKKDCVMKTIETEMYNWWNSLSILTKMDLVGNYLARVDVVNTTNLEIQFIWTNEVKPHKIINGIVITNRKVKRLNDGQVLQCIIPSPDLGLYKSLMYLKENGYVIDTYIEKNLVDLNPTRFQYLDID